MLHLDVSFEVRQAENDAALARKNGRDGQGESQTPPQAPSRSRNSNGGLFTHSVICKTREVTQKRQREWKITARQDVCGDAEQGGQTANGGRHGGGRHCAEARGV